MAGGVADFDSGQERRALKEVGETSVIEEAGLSYTVIYGRHNVEQPHPPLQEFGGIILEGVGDRLSQGISEAGLESVQYRALVEEARRLGKPIFLPDIAYDPNLVARDVTARLELEKLLGITLALPAVAAAGGAAQAGSAHPHRRNVLIGASALFGVAAVGVLGKAAIEDSQSRREDPIQEERNVLELKNAVIAQKSETIARQVGKVGVVIGVGHGEVEQSFRATASQRASDALRALHEVERSAGREAADKIKEQIALITRLDYDEVEKNWRLSVVEDPILARLKNR